MLITKITFINYTPHLSLLTSYGKTASTPKNCRAPIVFQVHIEHLRKLTMPKVTQVSICIICISLQL